MGGEPDFGVGVFFTTKRAKDTKGGEEFLLRATLFNTFGVVSECGRLGTPG